MELDPKPAVEKILELVAIIMLTLTSIALGLMLGLATSWVIWNSAYLRNMLRRLFTAQHDVPMAHVSSIHEDSSSDSSDSEYDDTAISEQVSAHEQGPQDHQ